MNSASNPPTPYLEDIAEVALADLRLLRLRRRRGH
jgi:hypothetical protein